MSDDVEVRDAAQSDREALEAFHRNLYIGHRDRVVDTGDLPLVDYRDYERILAEDLASLLSDRGALVLVAESGGRVVGYITGRVRVESRRVLPRRKL